MKILYLISFLTCASGIKIGCYFHKNGWGVIGEVYTCQVRSMNFSDNGTYITGSSGTHLGGFSNADVKMVYFHPTYCPQFNLTFIPQGFVNIFPTIIGMRLDQCALRALNVEELEHFENFRRFSVISQNFERIFGRFSLTMPNVEMIDFTDSQIQHVGEGLFDGLEKLNTVYFIRNACIDAYAPTSIYIPGLIEDLRTQCPDIDPDTTTTITTTEVTTTELSSTPPKCEVDDVEDFVCGLDEENKILRQEIENQAAKILDQGQQLESHTQKLDQQAQELQTVKSQLEELEAIILELVSRPCAC